MVCFSLVHSIIKNPNVVTDYFSMVKVVNKSGTDQIAFNLAVCMLSLMFATLLWQTWSKRKLYQELLEKISETIDKHDEKKPNFLTKENIIMHIYLFLCFIANFGMASGLILMSNKSVSMEGIYIMMGRLSFIERKPSGYPKN